MITEVVENRMEVVGLTQAKLSEAIGCRPTQLSLFLKEEAMATKKSYFAQAVNNAWGLFSL